MDSMTVGEARKQAEELLGTTAIALICYPGEPLPFRVGVTVHDPRGEHTGKCDCCGIVSTYRIDVLGRGESWEAALGQIIAGAHYIKI